MNRIRKPAPFIVVLISLVMTLANLMSVSAQNVTTTDRLELEGFTLLAKSDNTVTVNVNGADIREIQPPDLTENNKFVNFIGDTNVDTITIVYTRGMYTFNQVELLTNVTPEPVDFIVTRAIRVSNSVMCAIRATPRYNADTSNLKGYEIAPKILDLTGWQARYCADYISLDVADFTTVAQILTEDMDVEDAEAETITDETELDRLDFESFSLVAMGNNNVNVVVNDEVIREIAPPSFENNSFITMTADLENNAITIVYTRGMYTFNQVELLTNVTPEPVDFIVTRAIRVSNSVMCAIRAEPLSEDVTLGFDLLILSYTDEWNFDEECAESISELIPADFHVAASMLESNLPSTRITEHVTLRDQNFEIDLNEGLRYRTINGRGEEVELNFNAESAQWEVFLVDSGTGLVKSKLGELNDANDNNNGFYWMSFGAYNEHRSIYKK